MVRGFLSSRKVSLDSKGRVAIPSRYRDRLMVDADGCLVLTINPINPMKRSLWLYPLPEWELIEEKLAALSDFDEQSSDVKRMMYSFANPCQLDAHGRILIPADLRNYAHISKQAVILGQGNKFEIWNKASWDEQREPWLIREHKEPSAALQSLSL